MTGNPAAAEGSIRALIFDLDGTLVDTAGEMAIALNRTFGELQFRPLASQAVANLIGRGVHSLVERALQLAGAEGIVDVEAAVTRFEEHYARIVGTQARLFDAVQEGLRLLRDAGLPLSVVTNKPRYFTEKLLERLAVRDFFAALIAGDDGIARKPSGDMLGAACRSMGSMVNATLMIGDSENDVAAARNAGCRVWCVPYGYNEGRGPETLQCDRMVASILEAARLICAPPPTG